MSVHKYFENSDDSKWSIVNFLNACELEPFERKIDCYTKSLENIANTVEDCRRESAQQLLDRYYKEPQTDRKTSRKWEKERSSKQFHVNQPIFGIGNINGGTAGNINGFVATESSKREVLDLQSDDDFQPPKDCSTKRKKKLSLSKKSRESVSTKKVKSTEENVNPFVSTEMTNGISGGNSIGYSGSRTPPRQVQQSTSQVKSTEENVNQFVSTEMANGTSGVNSIGYGGSRTPPRQIRQSTQDLIRRLSEEKLRVKSKMEPICSNIIDTTNTHLIGRTQLIHDYHWEPITNDTTKYIDELIENSDSCSNLRKRLQVSFMPSGEIYSFNKHYEMSWVHRFADKL